MEATTKFVDVSVTDFPGKFVRCTGCDEVLDPVTSATHKCPQSAPQQLFEQEEADIAASYSAVSAAEGAAAVLAAIHSAEAVRKIVCENRVSRTEKAFPMEVLRKIAHTEIVSSLGRVREMREEEYALNDTLRAKGVPYIERIKKINPRKIEWCDKQEAKYMHMLEGFSVRPLRQWFDEVDYVSAKQMGMGWVMRLKLEDIIIFSH